MAVRRRNNPNIRFYVAIGVILLLIGVLLFVLLYHGTEEITERGAMDFTVDTSAIVIRDETTYVSSEFTRIEYLAREGAEVKAGDELASVYRLGYNDELTASLLDIREQVYHEQLRLLGSVKDQGLEDLEDLIVSLRKSIADAVMSGSGEDIASLQERLDAALTARREYLTKVQAKEELNALYSSEENQLDIVTKWKDTVSAEADGRISYYFDGYEQAINAQKLSLLTTDLISGAVKSSASAKWTTDDRTRVCRVVDPDHWYVAFLTEKSGLTRVAEGVSYTVDIEGFGVFEGVALEPVISGSRIINVIKIDADMGGLIDVRTAKIRVYSSLTGIRVKRDAIINEDGYCYLELVRSESHYRMRVDVLAVIDDFAIVRPHESEDTLGEGVRYWKK